MGILIAFILTFLLKQWFPRLGTTNKSIDKLSRWNTEVKPTVGGIVFYSAMMLFFGTCLWTLTERAISISYFDFREAIALLIGSSIAFGTGLWDDVSRISPAKKLGGQVLAGLVLIAGGFRYYFFETRGVDASAMAIILDCLCTLFIVVAFMNSVNMMDNMDAVAVVVVLPIFVIAYVFLRNDLTGLLILLMGSALLGFLIMNWYPSKVFMGDSGSMLLGFLVAYLAIHVARQHSNSYTGNNIDFFITRGWEMLFILVACPLLIIDTAVVVINRLRHGVSITQGGKDHTSHHLFYLGISQRWVAVIFLALGLAQIGIAVLIADAMHGRYADFHIDDVLPAIVYFFLLFTVMLLISFRNLRKGKYSYSK